MAALRRSGIRSHDPFDFLEVSGSFARTLFMERGIGRAPWQFGISRG
ncbi:hypothetical protein [Sphingosinicella sp. BN140058]|nr:hypothetical protein [Sphingosinicella sp. BN140058]